jgi:hypothetical protein
MNFIMSVLGAAVLVAAGAVLGFWIQVLTTPELPNGMKSCTNCGPTFAETARFWRGSEHTTTHTGRKGQ